jgi:hypothetical protein
VPAAARQDGDDGPQRARAVLESATRALGGDKYLNVQTVIGKGLYTQFDEKGELAYLAPFVDYIAYPDKERTEFGKKKKRTIQTNVSSTGWVYDGEANVIREQTEEQITNFKRGFRRNLDGLLRRWRSPDAQLRYLGEKEIWARQRGQGVEMTFTVDGEKEVITLHVDPSSHQPVMIAYEKEEDRLYLYREFGGIVVPLRIDHYEGGILRGRIAYDSLAFNQPIDPTLFDKPPHPDKIK